MKFTLNSKQYLAYLLLSIVITCCSFLCYRLYSDQHSNMVSRSDLAAELLKEKIHTALKRYEVLLSSFRTLYEERAGIVVRDVFELYSSSPVQTIPGLYCTGFAQQVHRSSAQIFIFNARREGYLHYAIHPVLTDTTGVVGLYITPFGRNPTLSGFNFFSNSPYRTTILQARDNNSMALCADTAFPELITVLLPVYAPMRESVDDVFRAQPSTQRQLMKFMDTLVIQSKVQVQKPQRILVDTTSLAARQKNFSGVVFFQIALEHLLDSIIQQTISEKPDMLCSYTLTAGHQISSRSLLPAKPQSSGAMIDRKTMLIPFAGATLWLYCNTNTTSVVPSLEIILCFVILMSCCGILWWFFRFKVIE